MSKLLRVSNSKYRVVISDILPYERPVFFSNRFFSRLLKYYGIKTEKGQLVATKHTETEGLNEFLLLLGGNIGAKRPCFQYSITKDSHKEGRCLSVIHPYHQVEMVEFYDKYKNLLVDFCQRSNYSIRYPYKVADYQKKQKGYHKIFSDNEQPIDSAESLKHFFAYKYYRNINFFYGDYRFLRAEKKFIYMTKIDLKNCFENISPTQLSNAMFGCDFLCSKGSVAYDFCSMQQSFMNVNNGIVIGPEFSRIYAEIILQKIDIDTERSLDNLKIIHKKDYIFFRYVDDGYLFYNELSTRVKITSIYSEILKKYNLQINEKKTIHFANRPFLENISTAKTMLLHLVDERFQNRLETFRGFVKAQNDFYDTPTQIDYKTFVNETRSIVKSCGINYKDITSFLFGIIQKRLIKLLDDFNNLYGQYTRAYVEKRISPQGLKIKESYESEFITFSKEIIEVFFYLLSCDMRMSTSIKVVSLINKLQLFVRGSYDIKDFMKSQKFPMFSISLLDEKVSDEISTLFLNIIPTSYNLMELLNVLELEKIMMPKTQISSKILNGFFDCICENNKCLNFFTVFEIFHFVKDNSGYDELKNMLYKWIDSKISSLSDISTSSTEAVLTLLETMCCPWIDESEKLTFLRLLPPDQQKKIIDFTQKQKSLFIKWKGYNVFEAIEHINSTEVY